MIITRTPYRVSLLGGGTDYPSWSSKHGGLVVGGAVNRYAYVTCRHLPPFHGHRHRVVYREIETVDEASAIKHRAVRACVEELGLTGRDGAEVGLEVAHLSDLPARSGTGSSSTFAVGLLASLGALAGRQLLPHELAREATRIEREVLGEAGGCQDQVWAAHGGLNALHFRRDGEVDVEPLPLDAGHAAELEAHLLLFFTGVARTSGAVAATYAPGLGGRTREQFAMMRLAGDGVDAILRRDWERLGGLVDQSWRLKCGLSDAVTSREINALYAAARLAGAFGGKLTGAGGGGCLVLVAPPDKKERITHALRGCVHIPFAFEPAGARVVFADRDNLTQYRAA